MVAADGGLTQPQGLEIVVKARDVGEGKLVKPDDHVPPFQHPHQLEMGGTRALGYVAACRHEILQPLDERLLLLLLGVIPSGEGVEVELTALLHKVGDISVHLRLHAVKTSVVIDSLNTFHHVALLRPLVAVDLDAGGHPLPASAIEHLYLHKTFLLSRCGLLPVKDKPRTGYICHSSSFFK